MVSVARLRRKRGGGGATWRCTVKPLPGDKIFQMQPQVTLTWGTAHTCAAPGAAPGGDQVLTKAPLSPNCH